MSPGATGSFGSANPAIWRLQISYTYSGFGAYIGGVAILSNRTGIVFGLLALLHLYLGEMGSELGTAR